MTSDEATGAGASARPSAQFSEGRRAILVAGLALSLASSALAREKLPTAPAPPPAASTAPAPAPTPPLSPPVHSKTKSAPGVYPVYVMQGRWALVDRFAKGTKRTVRPGSTFLVVGSRAADLFTVVGATMAWGAACGGRRPVRAPIFYLSRKAAARVGTPIIGIAVAPGKRLDPGAAKFYRLENQVGEDTYKSLEKPLRERVVEELRSGEFLMDVDDGLGQSMARDPKPERIQLKIDFGSSIRLAGARQAFAFVDGVQVSKTFRRCLRLSIGDRLVGGCAEMPHALMAETNLLDFAAYDPNADGHPFILAYTTREPMWGHERWGARITGKGPVLFVMDSLDPRCRERF